MAENSQRPSPAWGSTARRGLLLGLGGSEANPWCGNHRVQLFFLFFFEVFFFFEDLSSTVSLPVSAGGCLTLTEGFPLSLIMSLNQNTLERRFGHSGQGGRADPLKETAITIVCGERPVTAVTGRLIIANSSGSYAAPPCSARVASAFITPFWHGALDEWKCPHKKEKKRGVGSR